jgi:hypothetical protein
LDGRIFRVYLAKISHKGVNKMTTNKTETQSNNESETNNLRKDVALFIKDVETHINTKPSYEYTGNRFVPIDIERILNDVSDSEQWVAITNHFGKISCLFIRNKFLKNFYDGDEISVGNQYLHCLWGEEFIPYMYNRNGKICIKDRYSENKIYLKEWRTTHPGWAGCEITTKDIENLRKAAEMMKHTSFKVYVSSDFNK